MVIKLSLHLEVRSTTKKQDDTVKFLQGTKATILGAATFCLLLVVANRSRIVPTDQLSIIVQSHCKFNRY